MPHSIEADIVASVHGYWKRHFSPLQAASLAQAYAEDAILFGSAIAPYVGRAQIQKYFEQLPQDLYIGVEFVPELVVSLTTDVISMAGSVIFQRQGLEPLDLRITHVLVKRKDQWLIASHHVSPKKTL